MVVFGQNGCILAKLVLIDQSGCIWQNSCIWAEVVVFGQNGCILAKLVLVVQKRLYLAK